EKAARDYFTLSLAYLSPPPAPTLIVTCGLMGSGKSFLAEKLGLRLGIQPLRSDVIRKEIYSVPQGEHRLDKYGKGLYSSNATEVTYDALFERARRALSAGEWVILDASFMRRTERDRAMRLAQETGSGFRILECAGPDRVLLSRLTQRMEQAEDPSDGRTDLFTAQKRRFEPVTDDQTPFCRTWDSTSEHSPFLTEFVRELMVTR
ncbi:AAA family ATPase, partial [Thermodesulfobacteriota bacterium]